MINITSIPVNIGNVINQITGGQGINGIMGMFGTIPQNNNPGNQANQNNNMNNQANQNVDPNQPQPQPSQNQQQGNLNPSRIDVTFERTGNLNANQGLGSMINNLIGQLNQMENEMDGGNLSYF